MCGGNKQLNKSTVNCQESQTSHELAVSWAVPLHQPEVFLVCR
jgi:hypothetical protein